MPESSARHALPSIQASQAQKHVTHNEALEQLDLLVQLTVEEFGASTPPGLREDGQIWALGPEPSGEWAGQADRLAAWANGAWLFLTPQPGWRAVRDTELRLWSGSEWRVPDLPELQNLDGLGIQSSYDATNRLAVSSEATLLTNAGAGHQLKINKNGLTDTASLLFQTGWSGRAEMGTAGSDAWSIKVSADGNTWRDALIADPDNGEITMPEGLNVNGSLNLPAASLDLASDPAFAGQLPLTSGGTGASTPAGARTALGLGSAATANTTTSAVDTTPERLLRVGDFGLGATSPDAPADLEDLGAARFIGGAGSTANLPPGVLNQWMGITASSNPNNQMIFGYFRGENAFFGRAKRAGTWASWEKFYTTQNVVGDMADDAVIQRGTGPNGEFVRFADGTQICWHELNSSSSDNTVWTFPAEFVAPASSITPIITPISGATSGARMAHARGLLPTQLIFATFNSSGGQTTSGCRLAAIGRWY